MISSHKRFMKYSPVLIFFLAFFVYSQTVPQRTNPAARGRDPSPPPQQSPPARQVESSAGLEATGGQLPRNQNPVPERATGEAFLVSHANLIALHNANSPRYQANCLSSGCHANIFNRVTLNPSIREAHQTVETMGLPPAHCTFCHQSVEIVVGLRQERGNAGTVGKNVNVEFKCAPCHGSSPVAKPLYMK